MFNIFTRKSQAKSDEDWDSGLQQLMQAGFITAYALVSKSAHCEVSEGLLKKELQDQLVLQQFAGLFHAREDAPLAFNIAGNHAVVFKKTESDLYAISKHRMLGVCVNALPFGVLITTYARPMLPQVVVPKVQRIADRLRK